MKSFIAVISISVVAVALGVGLRAELTARAIPAAYREQLSKLEDDRVSIRRRLQDLDKERTSLVAADQWNIERESSVACEALRAMGLSPTEYQVDAASMTVKRIAH